MNAWNPTKDDSAEWRVGKGGTRIGLYLVAQFLQALDEDRLDMSRVETLPVIACLLYTSDAADA